MKRGMGFWDVIAWIILFGIFVWLILKVLGIINTPLWIEYSPIFGAVYLAGWAMKKLDTAVDEIRYMKKFAYETSREINGIKENCYKNHSK
jgi:hypothetical protein